MDSPNEQGEDLFSVMYAGHDCWTHCCKQTSTLSLPYPQRLVASSVDWRECAAVKGALWPHIAHWIRTEWQQPAQHTQNIDEDAARRQGDAAVPLLERSRLLAKVWKSKLDDAHRERMQAAAEELRDSTVPQVRASIMQNNRACKHLAS